jgi:undecaprenyl-diphosphatase
MLFLEILKAAILGVIEGITEWLPISSTGHMILVDQFMKLEMSPAFKEMFLVVIQLGAILAVVVLYWNKINPFPFHKTHMQKKETASIWFNIIIACVPAVIVALFLDDTIESLFYNYQTVAVTLAVYGVLFILIENRNRNKTPAITQLSQIDGRTALMIGLFQLLSLIPGTSRSGTTIIGAMLIGSSRSVAAEFTFLLGIPVMFGASFLKLFKFGFNFTGEEITVLITGMAVAFIVSIFAIRFLTSFIKKHDFKPFGWYRIVLGAIVFFYFILQNNI